MKNLNIFNIVITISAICLGLALGLGLAQAGGALTAPDKAITIDGKKPVKFDHAKHLDQGLACGECHHDGEHAPRTAETIAALPDSSALKCATCHTSDFAKPELQNRKDIFHANCKECHKSEFNGKQGPTKCSGCHTSKKAVEGC